MHKKKPPYNFHSTPSVLALSSSSNLERWSYLIEKFHNLAAIPVENLFGFDQVIDLARIDRLDEEEQQEYLNAMATQYDILVHTEAAYKKGEREKALSAAKKMKSEGIPLERISFYLDLPIEDIEAL